jgi:hypothetical protein
VTPDPGSKILMLAGGNKTVDCPFTVSSGVTQIHIPAGATAGMTGPGYTFKITGQPASAC